MGRHPHDWTEAEDNILRDIWHGFGVGTLRERIAELVPNRTFYAAAERASKLGLTDRDEASNREKAEIASARLLALLQEHHGSGASR